MSDGSVSTPDQIGGQLCLVTGAAGFIGSHLCERLLREGYQVVGIDALTDSYSPELKRRNLLSLQDAAGFRLIVGDLLQMDLYPLVEKADYIFHLAGLPGVRGSFGAGFHAYVERNIIATQQLLEVARQAPRLRKLVYASSSSVYGDSPELPLMESSVPQPVSPYGVTKLAAEHLVCLYATNFQVPTVALRYFTVYGPRQRPDMAFHGFLRAIYANEPLRVYGDGEQTRDFTYVTDVVQANLLAMSHGGIGAIYNIAGGSRVTLNQCLDVLARVTGRELRIVHDERQHGDMRHTYADISLARRELRYEPLVSLEEGLAAQDKWFREVILPPPPIWSGGSGERTPLRN